MIKRRWHWKIWLAASGAVIAAVLGLTAPVQAQVSQPSRPASTPGTTTQSLQSLDQERPPAGSKRWVLNDPVAYAQAVKTGKWLRGPYGLSYSSCVYRAPNDAVVEANKIISPSGAVQHITPCTHPTLTNGARDTSATGPSAAGPNAAGPSASKAGAPGPIIPGTGPCYFGSSTTFWALSCDGTDPYWLTYMSQEYAVPSDPAKDGALAFIWGGLENPSGYLLQDVLTWGANGNIVTNPNIWYVTDWYLWPGNNSMISPSMHVAPVDTIVANLSAWDCDGSGNCSWTLQSTDENNGDVVTLNVTGVTALDILLGAVLEVPRASGCVEMPANGHAAFRDLSVFDNNGELTPDFGTSITDHQCSVSMTASSTGADILWSP